ncbi:LOW QUALITY PROTEIN: estrogen receptor 2b [Neosynchiropus ocellatus]
MASPGLDLNQNTVQLHKVGSSRHPDRLSPLPPLPVIYSPPPGPDAQAVCIPSPYVDSGLDFGPLTFYSPPVLGYARPPIADCPSVSAPQFWPSGGLINEPPLSVHCPPPPVYHERHGPWTEPGSSPLNSFMSSCKLRRSENSEGKSELHLCAVCQDYASGYHYGVWSCEGCKAFFKRSIQGHTDYICPATNQCTIDKNRRKSCQACRLRRCYEVGMMKCGVRRERCSYRGAHHRRNGPQAREPTARTLVRAGQTSQTQRHLRLEGPLAPSTPLLVTHKVFQASMSPEEFIARIIEAEPPEIYLMEDLKKPFTETSMMMSLTSLADKELVLMISWAKKIPGQKMFPVRFPNMTGAPCLLLCVYCMSPGFMDLGLSDQIHLLKCCWLEVLMLGLMWRSVDHPGKLIFSPDFKLNRDEGQCVEGIMEIFDLLLAATSRFRELQLQREEYVCLKAMILLNSNLCSSPAETPAEQESRKRLMSLLDLVIDALVWAISKTGLSTQQQTLRLGHLTMLLSHVRHVSNKGMDHLSTMKRRNVVLVYDLLLEMLDANTPGSENGTRSDQSQRVQPEAAAAGSRSGDQYMVPSTTPPAGHTENGRSTVLGP